ncbi:MAG: site-specific recombinase [Microscillaceae bacterium]|nr:site-specific recombinase [Microscillaceae bacterium]
MELNRKIAYKILPEYQSPQTYVYLLKLVFHKSKDYVWVQAVPDEVWIRLFNHLGLKPIADLSKKHPTVEQFLNALLIISLRITTIGLEPEIVDRLPELEKFGSPFLGQNLEVDRYIENFKNQSDFDQSPENTDYKQILVMLTQCGDYVDIIQRSRDAHGITLNITYALQRLSQNIRRMKTLLAMLVRQPDKPPFAVEVAFFKESVQMICTKNSLQRHLQNNVSLLAYQVTEHASKTGEHYITSNRKEYWKMGRAASGGGFIVAFLCVFKTWIYQLKLPPFGEAFMYSLNYSFGFMTIYITGSALATKQPAMTAARIAQSLDEKDAKGTNKPQADRFAHLIAKVSRSQLIAFLGNILVAFPVAYLLALLYFFWTGDHIANPERANKMIQEIHPFRSYSLFHAGIAGIYLFLAGLISGYYDNRAISHKIPQRIRTHPFLRRIFPESWRNRLADYLAHNLGSLAGNFYLGIFLGTTGTIGLILGLPIDIRHITFASGNFGLAVVGLEHQLSMGVFSMTLLGVIGIGFMNFLVSFSLAIFVAIRSRRIKVKEGRRLFHSLRKLLFSRPMLFLFPPKTK